jgi:hypothetical protein
MRVSAVITVYGPILSTKFSTYSLAWIGQDLLCGSYLPQSLLLSYAIRSPNLIALIPDRV